MSRHRIVWIVLKDKQMAAWFETLVAISQCCPPTCRGYMVKNTNSGNDVELS